jgi:hypothetical protein
MVSIWKAVLLIALSLNTACSVFGIRTSEELDYAVVASADNIEVRQYDAHIAAQARLKGDHKTVQGDLFRVLAGYIFGKNSTQEDIAMTAPVVIDPAGDLGGFETSTQRRAGENEKIDMAAPVIMTQSQDGFWTMGFSMPSGYTINTLPKPLDDRVRLVEIPPRTLAVVQFSGSFDNEAKRAEGRILLQEWLKDNPRFRSRGSPFYAGYDPPFTLPFLRRNEVLMVIEAK